MVKKRIVLKFPPTLVGQPITYHLVKDYDLMLNILRGNVTPNEEGRLLLELSGKKKSLEDGIAYLRELGIHIEPLAHDIKWHEDKCTHCTVCIPVCPTNAILLNREAMEVSFVKEKCIACELCIPVCPFKALAIHF